MITKQVRLAWLFALLALSLPLAACGGSSGALGDDGGVTPDALPNDGPCMPGALRCNGNDSQKCNAEGTMWETLETCATFCQEGVCALNGLDVTADQSLDGVVVVAGAVTIRSAATLSSPTGNLTIFADTLTLENGGAIAMAPTGARPDGKGSDAGCSNCSTSGGSYGTGSRVFGSATDSEVSAGSEGGRVFQTTTVPVASGGGVVRLFIKGKAVIAGQITANGASGGANPLQCLFGGGGGSGGGVLVVADDLTFTGSISTAGGLGGIAPAGCNPMPGGVGGEGRVKLLFGAHSNITGTIVGVKTEGLAPPIPVKSLSHPDGTKIYNDGFISFDVEWNKAFPTAMGYFVRLDKVASGPPTAANASFLAQVHASFSPNDIFDGQNFVHLVSVDAQSAIGTIETVFRVQINTRGPLVSSQSHPNPGVFSDNQNPFFQWTFPQGDANVAGTHYVLDNFGDTVPTAADPSLPSTQKQLLQTNVPAGIWFLHVVSVDGQGRLTKAAGHYRVNIGTDPGAGGIQGNVVDSGGQPVGGALVTVNRGLVTTTTNANGTFNFSPNPVPAGMWELSVKAGAKTASKSITVLPGMNATGNLTLPP